MGYDEALAARIDGLVGKGYATRNMFGGYVWTKGGNMALGVCKDELVVRCGKTEAGGTWDQMLKMKGVRPFTMTGKSLGGFVLVDKELYKPKSRGAAKTAAGDKVLKKFMRFGEEFASSLPAKNPPEDKKMKKKSQKTTTLSSSSPKNNKKKVPPSTAAAKKAPVPPSKKATNKKRVAAAAKSIGKPARRQVLESKS